MKFTLLAAAALLAVPAFAQTTVSIPEDATAIVAPGRTITPSNSPVSARPIPGAVIAEERGAVQVIALDGSSSNNTATMGAGPAPGNRYWWNVPEGIENRADFRRWRGLQ
ncbi:MAG: hypothetical protein ACO1PB_21870 [Ramlibacter sp.]